MGHRLSKNQLMLPNNINNSIVESAAAVEKVENTIKSSLLQSNTLQQQHQHPLSATIPTSMVITICMLKMEPNDANNLNENINCSCEGNNFVLNQRHSNNCLFKTNNFTEPQQSDSNSIEFIDCTSSSIPTNYTDPNNPYSNIIKSEETTISCTTAMSVNGDEENNGDDVNTVTADLDNSNSVNDNNSSEFSINNLNNNLNTSNSNLSEIQSNNRISRQIGQHNIICDNESNNHTSSTSDVTKPSTSNNRNEVKKVEFNLNQLDVNNYKINFSNLNKNLMDDHQNNVTTKLSQINESTTSSCDNSATIANNSVTTPLDTASEVTVKRTSDCENLNHISNLSLDKHKLSLSADGYVTPGQQLDLADINGGESCDSENCQRKKSAMVKHTFGSKEKSKKSNWGIKLNCAKLISSKSNNLSIQQQQQHQQNLPNIPITNASTSAAAAINDKSADPCVCRSNRSSQSPSKLADKNPSTSQNSNNFFPTIHPIIDISQYNPDDYPMEDCDETARLQRAIEIVEGVDPPPGFVPSADTISASINKEQLQTLVAQHQLQTIATSAASADNVATKAGPILVCENNTIRYVLQNSSAEEHTPPRIIHSQVDYVHCLVPDLKKLTNCSFYWGKMDRYEAERLLEGKPEGTFLLRDSAQEEFLFSVSFRKYGRSLHARIEQFNHKFSFDCHDPGVYTATTVTGLLEHYKDPACVMFFEPALTLPLNRNFCFSLQQLCRATTVSHTTYDGINSLGLPKTLKSYLKEYHYKQKVCYRRIDDYLENMVKPTTTSDPMKSLADSKHKYNFT